MRASIRFSEGLPSWWTEEWEEAAGGWIARFVRHAVERFIPRDTTFGLLDWPQAEDASERVIAPDVVSGLSEALVSCGKVAFQQLLPPPAGDVVVEPDNSTFGEIRHKLKLFFQSKIRWEVVITSEPTVLARNFGDGSGWTWGDQVAIVYDPEADAAPIVSALQVRRNWSKHSLPAGARCFLSSVNDGAFALFASVEPIWRQRFLEALADPAAKSEHAAPL